MRESELAEELVEFGITKQEADLFLMLAKIRNAGPEGVTGTELSELAGFGRVRTYQLLDRLVDLGIVQVELGRPKRYLAENPQTAVRRLVALQESKLNELSQAEEVVADALAEASPLTVQKTRLEKGGRSRVTVLHGLSTIQGLLRRAMQERDLRAIVNDESEDHFFTTVRYMTKKPKSVRVIFATADEKRHPFKGRRVEIEGYKYGIKLLQGDLPTIVLNGEQSLMLFYESQRYRPKPLSPMTVRTVVNSCVAIEGAKDVGQMETAFAKLWDLAE
jgi:sugar-specific transcriptional regulator TrmB